jgi:hypothetical protein
MAWSNRRSAVAVSCLFFSISTAAHSETPSLTPATCPKPDEHIGGPFISTPRAARAVYLAIERDIAPFNLKRYPIVTVHDVGDHWEMSQTRRFPPIRHYSSGRLETVSVMAGGGMLDLDIDKCTGAISNAQFDR